MTDLDVVAHMQRLRRYARFLCRDAADADDLVQETLAKAIRRAGQFRPDADLRAWLFGILHNTFVSGTRATERHRRAVSQTDADDGHSSPPAQETQIELRRALAAVDRLPEDQRRVILLVSIDGMTTDEAAVVLELPVGTVRSRLARGREVLRRSLRNEKSTRATLRVVGGHNVQDD